ncbi:MAG: glycoside hydrolase family 25 protein [Eubacterium sp.]|nr:glycoside hydrolase family 25 protein [Eubacterium sp.]
MATKTTKKKNTGNKCKSKGRRKTAKESRISVIITAIAVILLNVLVLTSIVHYARTPKMYDFGKERSYGIDVSSHNGKIDWEKVSKKVDFAFIRVGCRGYGDGNIFLDEKAKYNMKQAQKYGVPYGVYIYSQAITAKEAEEEAKFLIRHIRGYNVELPLVFDFEYAYSGSKPVGRLAHANLTEEERTYMAKAFCKTVKRAGYMPALYASSYIYKSQIKPKNLPKGTVIWVADYNDSVTYDGSYDIWQFSESGKVDGISTAVDTDYWYQ